jgi:hypothetical protein
MVRTYIKKGRPKKAPVPKKIKLVKPPPPPPDPNAKKYATIEQASGHCNISAPTFRNYLRRYPDIPIVERGINGYKIDLEALDEWRARTGLLTGKSPLLVGDNMELPLGGHKNKKEKVQTDLLQLEYDTKSGKMVEKQEVIKYFSTKMANLAKNLEYMPIVLGKKMDLAPEIIEEMRKMIDEMRHALMHDDSSYFTGAYDSAG